MKTLLLILAASFGTATFASAQTSATQSAPRTPNSASPSVTPSGTSPSSATNSVGGVSAGEVFTKGDPANQKMRNKREKQREKMDGTMTDGKKRKMKTTM